jgi:hypothetical protein
VNENTVAKRVVKRLDAGNDINGNPNEWLPFVYELTIFSKAATKADWGIDGVKICLNGGGFLEGGFIDNLDNWIRENFAGFRCVSEGNEAIYILKN